MVIIAVTAIAAFIAAPYLRLLAAEQWSRIAKTLAAALLGAAVWTGAAHWLQRRAELRAGKRLVSVALLYGTSVRCLHVALILLGPLMILLFCYLAAHIPPNGNDWMMRYVNPFMWGVLSAQQWTFYIDSFSAAFCENGIVWSSIRFTAWSIVHVLYRDRAAGQLGLSLKGTQLSLKLTDDDWPTVSMLLRGNDAI